MKPLMLKGHSRPLTMVMYNRESDLLFSAGKDHSPTVWYAHNGERLGTYDGHNGSVWALDVDFHSKRLVTGSSDTKCKIWDVQTGKELASIDHKSMVRSVSWAEGDRMITAVTDQSFSQIPTINIYNVPEDISTFDAKPTRSLQAPDLKRRINTALWGSLNETIISGDDDGMIRLWDVETGKQINKIQAHTKKINHMKFNSDRTMFVTAGADHVAKVYDTKTCKCLKEFRADRPLNSAAISPIMNHVIVGGGQEAMDVTTTDARVGHFEVDFFHLVYMERLGSVRGHFGPVNTVAFANDGKSFASGAEDGYLRLHHFDKDYFTQKTNY